MYIVFSYQQSSDFSKRYTMFFLIINDNNCCNENCIDIFNWSAVIDILHPKQIFQSVFLTKIYVLFRVHFFILNNVGVDTCKHTVAIP